MVNRAGVCGGMVEACLRFGGHELAFFNFIVRIGSSPRGGGLFLI